MLLFLLMFLIYLHISFLSSIFFLICALLICPINSKIKIRPAFRIGGIILSFIIAIVYIPTDTGTEVETASEIGNNESSIVNEKYTAVPVSDIVSSNYIFYYDLVNNVDTYVNQTVSSTFQVESCDDDNKNYRTVYDQCSFDIYPTIYETIAPNEYITITGQVVSDYEIENATIIERGSIAEEKFKNDKSSYDERVKVEAIANEESFREEVEEITYDELLRYPDSYKNKKIKLDVSIYSIDPDGIVFPGACMAYMSGSNSELSLNDDRSIKEPKLLEGDHATIYGYGDGLAVIKVQDKSGIIPKTIDKYSIPSINIMYMDIN